MNSNKKEEPLKMVLILDGPPLTKMIVRNNFLSFLARMPLFILSENIH